MKIIRCITIVFIQCICLSSGEGIRELVSDVEFDILSGRNIAVLVCKPEQITLDTTLRSIGMNGYVSFGDNSHALIKQKVVCQKILYISPSVKFSLSGGNVEAIYKNDFAEISEVWVEVEKFGGDLVLMQPFEDLKSKVIIAEPLKVGSKFILVARYSKPAEDAGSFSEVIKSRTKTDETLLEECAKIIKARAPGPVPNK